MQQDTCKWIWTSKCTQKWKLRWAWKTKRLIQISLLIVVYCCDFDFPFSHVQCQWIFKITMKCLCIKLRWNCTFHIEFDISNVNEHFIYVYDFVNGIDSGVYIELDMRSGCIAFTKWFWYDAILCSLLRIVWSLDENVSWYFWSCYHMFCF